MLGSFVPEANFNPINAIDSRIAGGSPPQNLNAGSRKESQVGKIIAYFIRQIDAFHHACTAYFRVTQSQNVHRATYPTKLVLFTILHREDLCRTLWFPLKYGRKKILGEVMVRPEGVEPPTYWFVARRSIQLSYGRTLQGCN